MGQKIGYKSDKTGAEEEMEGSDGRANVSSRVDSRSYYSSRDDSHAFSLLWVDASTETGDFVAYWKNDDATGEELVISSVGLNSQFRSDFELHVVTGTAVGGTTATPVCLNRATIRGAAATALTAVSAPITGITSEVIVDHASIVAGGHEELRLGDRVRLGQGQAIAIKCRLTDTSPGRSAGIIYGFYE